MRYGLILLGCFAGVSARGEISFNRDVRPIMSNTCFACHGPDKSSRLAGLRLDIRDQALKPNRKGIAPIVPGDPEGSAVIQRVFASDSARVMPPKYAHKDLTLAQKQTLRQWVAEGARYEGHWAYEPVRRPAVPEGAAHPIDAFIRARLAREGLKPSPEAARRTLIRRVSLDLTGLPPAPSEVEMFLKDTSPDAYEKVVERLLASPRYAEKQALHWLDAVRYADTCGFHGDNPIPAWPYRDYVLRAFRDNKPFDEFTREQLAGDLMPEATIEQKVASAYNRLNRTSAEGGLQPTEYLAKYAADRVRTVSSVWLGSTVGCSECHDHKFDPFTSRDFYSLKAFFADIEETGLVPDRGEKAWGAQLRMPSAEQTRQLDEMSARLTAVKVELEAKTSDEKLTAWVKTMIDRHDAGELDWRYQRPVTATSANGSRLTIYNEAMVDSNYEAGGSLVSARHAGNGLIIADGPSPDNDTYTVTLKPGAGAWTALGLEVVPDESLPGVRVARGSDRLVITEVEGDLRSGRKKAEKLSFVMATGNLAFPAREHPAISTIDGSPKTGWGPTIHGSASLFLALRFAGKLETREDSVLTIRLRHDSEYRRATTGRFRLALSAAEYSAPEIPQRLRPDDPAPAKPEHSGLPAEVRKAIETPEKDRTEEQTQSIRRHFQWSSPELQALVAEMAKLEGEIDLVEASVPRVVTTLTANPPVTRILGRGNFMDDSGAIVQPAVPAFLGKVETDGRATRLDLANWIVSPNNPLTPRVFVNRLWRQFFGTGISKNLDDIGSQGEWPVHAELLDWLAAEFVQPDAAGTHRWDVKHMVRLMVTSQTYKQSSAPYSEADARDPDNRWLARQNRPRVDAEIVRDIALSASGLLADEFGGPSVKPYQPDGYLAALNFPKREYSASHGAELHRRGLYTFWQRTFLHPSLAAFDAPSREECTVNRTNSNTPLQALVLLNDPIYVEAARALAQNMLTDGGATFASQVGWAFERAVSRPPTEDERAVLAQLYRHSLARFRAAAASARQLIGVGESPIPKKASPAKLAAMTTVARAILNLHETITRN
ncbi:MAG: PSD1 and planctomycete cytochrome C domain-containing protein [Bryobacteraceae bacterium]